MVSSTASLGAATSSHAVPSCAAKLYDIPVQVASCAMPYGGNHTGIMSACCGSASVVSYFNDCGLFCLAQGQTVHQLTDCLFDHGADYSEVFCRGGINAEATGQATVAASASAHIMPHSATPTHSDSAAYPSSSRSAAIRIARDASVTTRIMVMVMFWGLALSFAPLF